MSLSTANMFDDDIEGLTREEETLTVLVEPLDKASTAYGMEISAKKIIADDKQH